MQKSLFIQYVDKLMKGFTSLVEKINGRNKDVTYLHKTMLRKEYSADQKWETAAVDTTFVTADMVAMDSPLPLKMRDTVSQAGGDLPKIGIKRVLREKQINTLNIMIAQGAGEKEVVAKLANDLVACSKGIDEKNEANFLEAISNGVVAIEDIEKTGLGYRANFNYLDANQFGVEKKGVVSYEDIKRVLEYADAKGSTISTIMISKTLYDKVRNQRWAKELVANYNGQVYGDSTNLPTPSASKFNDAFADDNGGVKFLVIDRTVVEERNGKRTARKPFNANKMVFLVSEQVGALVWSNCVEKTNPVEGVKYQVVDGYKLLAKYSVNEPALQEFTTGQALVLPVIEGVDQIFTLDITDVDDSAQTEGDENFNYDGKSYNKQAVIGTYNALEGVDALSTEISDAELLKAINGLSKAKATKLFAGLA
jgi:hypothetical protein